jgi:biotin/methionine sulfoxide reductase
VHDAYTEGRSSEDWIRWLHEQSRSSAGKARIDLPSFETMMCHQGWHKLQEPNKPHIMLAEFRADPVANPLRTPSGKIEIFSETIASFGNYRVKSLIYDAALLLDKL